MIKGNVKGIEKEEVYFPMPDNPELMDTIVASNGKFTYSGSSEELIPIRIYLNYTDSKKNTWITVWAQNGHSINLKGDADYPELILAKGVETNDLLTKFKTENKDIIQERQNLYDKLAIKTRNNSEELSSELSEANISSQILNLNQILKNKAEDFVHDHPGSIASLVLIQDYIVDQEDNSALKNLLDIIEGDARENTLFQTLVNYSKWNESTRKGNPAPDFTIVDLKNDTISLKNYSKKIFLLTFTSSHTDSIMPDLDKLEQLRKDFSDEQLGILSVSIDEDKTNWLNLTKEKDITWNQFIDNKGWASEIVSLYNITEIPVSFLIDENGIIIETEISIDEARKAIESKINNEE